VMAAVEMQKICVTFEATYIARRGATIHWMNLNAATRTAADLIRPYDRTCVHTQRPFIRTLQVLFSSLDFQVCVRADCYHAKSCKFVFVQSSVGVDVWGLKKSAARWKSREVVSCSAWADTNKMPDEINTLIISMHLPLHCLLCWGFNGCLAIDLYIPGVRTQIHHKQCKFLYNPLAISLLLSELHVKDHLVSLSFVNNAISILVWCLE
jgi:hypothetical protein